MNHTPVMLAEVMTALSPKDGETYVDGTFGAGGYSTAILEAANCNVIAIDRDTTVQPRADAMRAQYGARFSFVQGTFGDVAALLKAAGVDKVDGFVLDIGVSSMQLDQGARGFSFRHDAPLDMRMDSQSGQTAADIVNTTEETELANLIYTYGDERFSRRIARKIVEVRDDEPYETTQQLADTVRSVYPVYNKTDPATKTFQALRIAVNDELGQLEKALQAAPQILNKGGRLVVVSFHSLEDRIVKNYLLETSGQNPRGSRHLPETQDKSVVMFNLHKKGSIKPSAQEITANTRARSARLRWAVRT